MPRGSADHFYAEDLAYVHDAGFRGFADRAAPGVLRRLRRVKRHRGRVGEIGCGSGALTAHLVQAGHRVFALDVSRAMLRLARRRAPAAKFRAGSYAATALPPCGAIVAVGECLNYMAGTSVRAHQAALRRFFRRAAAVLPAGGLLLFDFLEPSVARPRRCSVERWGDDWVVLVAIGVDRVRRVLTRRITTIRWIGGRQRLSYEVHRQCLLRRRDLERELSAAGFKVRFRAGYGRQRLGPGHVVVDAIRVGA